MLLVEVEVQRNMVVVAVSGVVGPLMQQVEAVKALAQRLMVEVSVQVKPSVAEVV